MKIFSGLFRRKKDAERNSGNENGGQRYDGIAVHRFASAREQAVSDCRRIAVLSAACKAQRGGAADRCSGDTLRAVIEAAKANGLFVEKSAIDSFGDLVSKRTGESEVYWNRDEQVFYKIKNPESKRPIKHTSLTDWPYEHVIHNILFPETRYEFVGVLNEHNELRIVLKQHSVGSEKFPTEDEIATALAGKCLYPGERYFFGDGHLAVTDVGAHSDNVLVGDDRRVYFIDPLIRFYQSAEEIIEWLTGYKSD